MREETPVTRKLLEDIRSTKRVALMVDDNPADLELQSRALESLGVQVIKANSVEEALEHMDEHFDIALVDWRLPGRPGSELVAALHAAKPTTPVVIVTGCSESPEIRALTYVGLLAKPLNKDALKTLMAAHRLL